MTKVVLIMRKIHTMLLFIKSSDDSQVMPLWQETFAKMETCKSKAHEHMPRNYKSLF